MRRWRTRDQGLDRGDKNSRALTTHNHCTSLLDLSILSVAASGALPSLGSLRLNGTSRRDE